MTALAAWLTIAAPGIVWGQPVPTEPVSLGNGRLVLGAELTATVAPEDPGFFNYTDYETNGLRSLRLGVTAKLHAGERLQLLGELRIDDSAGFEPYALYARVRPWPARRFDVQIGRIPPTFGALSRTTYGTSNLLIGTPLAYQYLTSLRTDALPAAPADLIRMRGRGWLSDFPLGNTTDDRGLPLVNTTRWDTGLQVHAVHGIVDWTAAVTAGSLSSPRVSDDNAGRQAAARVVVRPAAGLALGTSVSRGAYLSESLGGVLPSGRRVEDGLQQALGLDVEYSAGHLLGRAEWIRSAWTLPLPLAAASSETLVADAFLVEGRYRLAAGLQAALRLEHLGFDDIATVAGPEPWEARVRRVEAGVTYTVVRNVIVKASVQRNRREGGRVRQSSLGALQLIYWF